MKIELDEKTKNEFVVQCPPDMTPTEFVHELLRMNKSRMLGGEKQPEEVQESYEDFYNRVVKDVKEEVKKELKEEIIKELTQKKNLVIK